MADAFNFRMVALIVFAIYGIPEQVDQSTYCFFSLENDSFSVMYTTHAWIIRERRYSTRSIFYATVFGKMTVEFK